MAEKLQAVGSRFLFAQMTANVEHGKTRLRKGGKNFLFCVYIKQMSLVKTRKITVFLLDEQGDVHRDGILLQRVDGKIGDVLPIVDGELTAHLAAEFVFAADIEQEIPALF